MARDVAGVGRASEQGERMSDSEITARQALDYEVRASWWAGWIGFEWGQTLASRYFAWKVNRKFRRYKWWIARERVAQ